jgi:hypothetical protein
MASALIETGYFLGSRSSAKVKKKKKKTLNKISFLFAPEALDLKKPMACEPRKTVMGI